MLPVSFSRVPTKKGEIATSFSMTKIQLVWDRSML